MGPDEMTILPMSLMTGLEREIGGWEEGSKVGRLWNGDASLWTGCDESEWIGWLRIAEAQIGVCDQLDRISPPRLAGFDDVLLLGMGGSSLCSDVLRLSFGPIAGAPRLHVLDSTDPSQIRSCEERLALDRTLFIVSSKSGTTLETAILMEYFLERVGARVGAGHVGERFIAVTDPGSALEGLAAHHGFCHVFEGLPSIGGRYSALSHFGTVPAAVMGIDVRRLLARAQRMRAQCDAVVPVRQNPGAMLGLTLGVAAKQGRDKVTFVASPVVHSLGSWVEQLLAESTGKRGIGLIPVDGEALGAPDVYGTDRLFVYVRDDQHPDPGQDTALTRLGEAGHPVLRITIGDRYDLGGEFFRWEFATAVAGAVLRINPFDQPDVEASKVETRRLTRVYERDGQLPTEGCLIEDRGAGLALYADAANAAALGDVAGRGVGDIVAAHCARLTEGDYMAILAYMEMSEAHIAVLQSLRQTVRDATGNATCVGFGPRFLHSTGQAYKGGANTGVFFQITCDDSHDLRVPSHRYSFGVVKAAQACGDLAVLGDRGRRVVRLHIRGDILRGLERIASLVGLGVQQQG